MRIEAVDRRGLCNVERFALRHALGNIEHDNVAELLQANEVSQRSADLTGANQSNLVACHGKFVLLRRREEEGGKVNWKAGYPFRMLRSSRGVPNCRSLAGAALISIKHACHSGMRRRSAIADLRRRPGIHSHDRGYGFRARDFVAPR